MEHIEDSTEFIKSLQLHGGKKIPANISSKKNLLKYTDSTLAVLTPQELFSKLQ